MAKDKKASQPNHQSEPTPASGYEVTMAQNMLGELPLREEDQDLQNYIEIVEKVNRGLRSYIAEMTIVFRFIERVSGIYSRKKIVDLLMSVIKELCGYDAAILYLNEASRHGTLIEQSSLHPEKIKRFRKTMEVDERIYNWVFRQGHAVIIPESFRTHESKTYKNWSYMIAPLATGSERLGHIELAFNRPQGSFTQQTFSILNVLLKHAAVILVNEGIYDKERQTAQKYIELDMLKKDVVNTTTHEIKTPLTIIQAASILLENDKSVDPDERKELLGKITQQCRRIDIIVTELFETAQLEDNQPPVNKVNLSLKSLTEEAIREVSIDPAKITITMSIPTSCMTYADYSSMYKVVRNLIENAIKYSPKGGEIKISGHHKGDYACWSITDQGIGISEIDQQQIFDKFFRGGESSTRSVGGIGLGLYIVKKNLELNNGKISVTSVEGEGSTFSLALPVTA